MEYFDLHCDTVNKCLEKAQIFKNTALKKCSENIFTKQKQIFALWTNDYKNVNDALRRRSLLFEKYISLSAQIKEEKITPYLSLENSNAVRDVPSLKEKGVILASLTWNMENEFACGAECLSGGLKPKGKELIEQYEKNGIVLDVSHLNFDSFYGVCKVAKKPFIASHSNAYSVCKNKRNLKDFQISQIISRGGIIGICFYPQFLGKGNVFENIYANVEHILSLGGENAIAIGSDFDGAQMDKKLKSSNDVEVLYEYLLQKSMPNDLLEKFFYKNSENFFNNVLH